jgi:hypothetical protein
MRGNAIPERTYCDVIVEALRLLGGSADTDVVCKKVHELVKDKLTSADYELVWTGKNRQWSEPLWRNRTKWARKVLIEEGVLSSVSQYGVWELVDARACEASPELDVAGELKFVTEAPESADEQYRRGRQDMYNEFLAYFNPETASRFPQP